MFSAWLAVIRALVWRPFWQGGLRSAFVIVGVALGVAITAAINLANHSALATFRDSIDLVAGRTHVQILPTVQTLPDTILTRLGWLRRLGDVNPVIEAICVVPQHHKTLRLIGVDLLHAGLSGSAEQPALRTDRPVLIHAGLAARWHLAVGDTLAAVADDRPVQFVVAGLIPSTGRTSGWDETFAVTDLAVAQDVLHRPGQIDRIDIQLADPDQTDDVVAALQAQLPPNARALTPERRNAQVGRMLRAFQANLAALSYIALLVGAYLIYNTLSVSVVQRRTEIGTLRALGVSGRQVFAAVTLEALMIGVVGSTLGLGLGLILAQGAVAAVSQTVNSLYINTGGAAAVHYDPLTMILSAMIGLLLSLAAAVLPAWEASGTAPAVAMRRGTWATKQQGRTALFAAGGAVLLIGAYGAALQPPIGDMPVFGYLAAMLIVVGASFLVPLLLVGLSTAARRTIGHRLGFVGRLATVNLGASVGRHSVAVASLMVGLAMILSVAVMIGSFRGTVESWVFQTLRADLYIRPAVQGVALIQPATLARLAALPGVAGLGPYREFSVTLGERITKLGAGDFRFTERFTPLQFIDNRLTTARVARRLIDADRIIVSETFAAHFGVKVSDRIAVPTPQGPVPMPIEGVYVDFSNEQGLILMDRSTFLRHFHDPRVNSITLAATSPGAVDGIRQAIDADPRLAGRLDVTGSGVLRREAMRIFDETFAITYALQVISMTVALLGVVATLVTLVLERRAEFGVLRAIGVTRLQIAAIIVGEAAGMGVAGCLVGTGAGYALALLLIRVINKQSFGWTIHLLSPWPHIGTSVMLVMVTALLAGIYPGYAASRLPIAEAVRTE